jgi:hypothetical protein
MLFMVSIGPIAMLFRIAFCSSQIACYKMNCPTYFLSNAQSFG